MESGPAFSPSQGPMSSSARRSRPLRRGGSQTHPGVWGLCPHGVHRGEATYHEIGWWAGLDIRLRAE